MEFKNKIEEEIDSVLELNQTSSSEIFFNIKHIKQAIKNSNKSSAQIKSNQTYIFPLHNFTFALKILNKDQLFHGVSVYLNLCTEAMK